ncbi:MAG: DUF6340 family protein [Bacteroidia bacterium]
MKYLRVFLPIPLLVIGLTCCTITSQLRVLQIEILKPGIFNVPENLSVAVINRDLFRSDTCTFYYSTGYFKVQDTNLLAKRDTTIKYQSVYEMIKDTSIKYQNLSDTCVNALINYLEEQSYFHKVIPYSDSLNFLLNVPGRIETRDKLFEKTKSDVCIFLDYFYLNTTYNKYFTFPATTRANLLWTVVFKTDSLAYSYNLTDTLFFDQTQVNSYARYQGKTLGQLLNNSSNYLGRSFGPKVIPTWTRVERMYYKSQNTEMLKAEKLALNQDWLKAAEIWNRETKNKNKKIATKASYNMAVACEMEGTPDAAIDWLVKSYTYLQKNNDEHRKNCQRYVNILVNRKKEIDRLDKQMKRKMNNSEN